MHLTDLAAQRAVLDALDGVERERSVLHAREARVLARMVDVWGPDHGGVVMEHAGASRLGQARAGGRQDRAVQLVAHYPVALGLLEHGVMRVGTVDILLALTQNASPQVQQRLDALLSERVAVMDAVDVRRLVARTLLEVESELEEAEQQRRREQARANRGVWAFGVQDGMARIGAELDEVSARRWELDFAELVRAQKVLDDRDGVVRTRAQREADVFAELPSRVLALAEAAARGKLLDLVGEPSAEQLSLDSVRSRDAVLKDLLRLPVRKPTVMHVHTAMTTLLDLDQRSGWIEGLGPVPAMQARMLVSTSSLRRVAVDPVTGVPLGVDRLGPMLRAPWEGEYDGPPGGRHRRSSEPPDPLSPSDLRERLLLMLGAPMYVHDRAEDKHDPSTALRGFVHLRDQACDGPGCPRPARACEVDHEQDWALGGQTAVWNLRDRSTRCHHGKHSGWTVTHDEAAAVTTWTSPAGSVYERRSVWQPPTSLPEDVELPEPRLVEPLALEPDAFARRDDEPLWPEPPAAVTPRPRVTADLRDLEPDGTTPQRPSSGATWPSGPPPF